MSSPEPAPKAGAADPFDLARFLEAQRDTYGSACAELAAGRKTSHWMWFVFPQVRGLGLSETAHFYGISSLAEAQAYLAHAVLGSRLHHTAQLILAIEGRSAAEIFGSPDDLKLRSSMTLFARATTDNADFQAVLDRYFSGQPDLRTLQLLGTV